MNKSVEELQIVLKKFLSEIDELFIKNDIKYFVAFGTLLGTVRHKGFIPWDDDVDIWMLRKDYDLFIKNFFSILPKYYEVEYCKENNNYPYSFAKIYDKRTTLVEYINDKPFTRGVYIDIFPIDVISDSMHKQKKHIQKINLINRYLLVKEGYYFNPLKKITICLLVIIVYRTLSKKKILTISQKLFTRFNSSQDKVIVSNHFPKKHYVLPKSSFSEIERLPFSYFYVNAPKKYLDILANIYGNFMEIPKDINKENHGKRIIKYNEPYKKGEI